LQPSGLFMTSSKICMDCSSTRKSSDKVQASRSSGSAIRHWRVCRRDAENRNLNGSTNKDHNVSADPRRFCGQHSREREVYQRELNSRLVLIPCKSLVLLSVILF
jgi:hypothetical protein